MTSLGARVFVSLSREGSHRVKRRSKAATVTVLAVRHQLEDDYH